jgi:hypothetical protein
MAVLKHYVCLPFYVNAHVHLPSLCEHCNAAITDTKLVLLHRLHISCDVRCKDGLLTQP